tara:strand:+ start:1957 stop:3522 length:1566 start_codon:yes stop_codon:yes gene_type:complete
MDLTYSLLKKLIEEADGENVIDFPVKSSNETLDFYLSAEQASILSSIVSRFGGALDGLLEPVAQQKMVAEGEVVDLPRAKKSEKPFLDMTAKEFEEQGYVLKVNREITESFKEMIAVLATVPDAIGDSKNWYYDVNNIIKSITTDENEFVTLATMIAAFSHNTDFYRNLLEAVFAFKAFQMDDKDCLSKYVSSMEGHTKKIKGGGKEEIDKFGKLKLTNFALNILDPTIAEDKENHWNATMDRWMFRAFYPGLDESVIKKMTGKNVAYIYLTKVLSREAEKLNMAVHELQAVIWVAIMYKTRKRVDTLPPLLRKIKDKFLTDMDGLEQTVEREKEDLSELKNVVPAMASRIRNPDMLKTYVKRASSEQKQEVLQAFEDKISQKEKVDCDPEQLSMYYVLENYVGMRRDKKRNIKAVLVTAIGEGWTIASGVEHLRSLIGFQATTPKGIIPENLDDPSHLRARLRAVEEEIISYGHQPVELMVMAPWDRGSILRSSPPEFAAAYREMISIRRQLKDTKHRGL